MKKGSLGAMAATAVAIGFAGIVGAGCGLDTPGGVVSPPDPPGDSTGPGKELTVPREGAEISQVVHMLEGSRTS